jgi:hypothetical protein
MLRNLFADIKFKILALLLGFGTWWMISRELPESRAHTREFQRVPVRIMIPSDFQNPVELSPDTTRVKLRGSSRILNNISPSQIIAYAMIPKGRAGVHIVPPAIFLSPELVKEGVIVEEVSQVKVDIRPPPQ